MITKCDSNNFLEKVDECLDVVFENKFGDRKVYPYSYPINVVDFLERMKDFNDCTYMSQRILIDELNGCIEHCINPWLSYLQTSKVKVRLNNGNEMEVPEGMAKALVKEKLAVEIK